MFVPRTRLLVWFALATLPLSLVGAMASSPLLSFAGTLAFVLIAAIERRRSGRDGEQNRRGQRGDEAARHQRPSIDIQRERFTPRILPVHPLR